MTPKLIAVLSTTLLAFSMAVAAPAAAMDNGPMSTIPKAGLEADGYSCELVSTGFWECTKAGGTTYWCDTGSCQPKPMKTGGGKGIKLHGTKLNTLNLMTRN
jgi:hypothetical protein